MSVIPKKVSAMLLFPLSVLATLILILVAILFIYSPGKPVPFLDNNGKPLTNSISEKVFVNIGGLKQGMFIKSKNIENPVLLYLHGGIPDYFLTGKYPTRLEEYFTVVWWEQRGSGLSYSANIPGETMNLDHMISDTKEVTNYLRNRLDRKRFSSWGVPGELLLASMWRREHRSCTMPTSGWHRCRTI